MPTPPTAHDRHPANVLVVTADVLTPGMAGAAVRAWEMAGALAGDHPVRLVTLSDRCQLASDRFSVATAAGLVADEAWADVVIVQGYALVQSPVLAASDTCMVVDLYTPLHLETLELFPDDPAQRAAQAAFATQTLNEQLVRGDFFLCATQKQRDFWLGQLAGVGRLNPSTYDDDPTLRRLIDVAPFGLPAVAPERNGPGLRGVVKGIGATDRVIVWGGGIYDWFDPLTLIRAVGALAGEMPDVRLFFMGTAHPNPEVPTMRMAAAARGLAGDLGILGEHVFFNDGWIDYDHRAAVLLDADVGVSTHRDHIETAYAFRTRILDYLWTGLPIVTTSGDAFADLVTSRRLGLVVEPGDVKGLARALGCLLRDDALAAECRRNVDALRPDLEWPKALAPLLAFCARPHRAADRPRPQAPAPPPAPTTSRRARRWMRRAARALLRRVKASALRGR